MGTDNELSSGEKLVLETTFYKKLLEQMVIYGDFSHGYTWSLGGRDRARQIYLDSGRAQNLTPVELGILGVGLSLISNDTSESRCTTQAVLIQLGILNADDIADHAYEMMQSVRSERSKRAVRSEHMCKREFVQNHIENAAIIIVLRRAYEALQKERNAGKLHDCEDRVILGYVIAILGDSFKMRPYMIDPELQEESWVDVYDHLFDNFSEQSREKYIQEGYDDLWKIFLSFRNEIAQKKRHKQLMMAQQGRTQSILDNIVKGVGSTQLPPSV